MSTTTVLDGASSLFPKRNFSSTRRQIIDYYGTRSSDGIRSLSPKRNLFVHETTNYRLLRYSISVRDKFPISKKDLFIHETTIDRLLRYSILGWDNHPISQKGKLSSMIQHLVDHYGTRPPEDNFPIYKTYSSMRRQSTTTVPDLKRDNVSR